MNIKGHNKFFIFILVTLCVLLSNCANAPVKTEATVSTNIFALQTNNKRDVPIRALYPTSSGQTLGVIIFSHGAVSDYDLYDKVLTAWAAHGYLVLVPQHIDSPQNPLSKTYPQMQQWELRLQDMQTIAMALSTIDQRLPSLKINPARLIVAGHSFGAITALAMAGSKTYNPASGQLIEKVDLAPLAVIALSPPGLIPKYIEKDAFAELVTPTLVQTGTADILPNFMPDWRLHRAPYDLSPAGDKVLAVGTDVDHYFGGLIGRFEVPGEPQVAALEDFKALTLNFLDAYDIRNEAAAKKLQQAGKDGQWSETIAVEIR